MSIGSESGSESKESEDRVLDSLIQRAEAAVALIEQRAREHLSSATESQVQINSTLGEIQSKLQETNSVLAQMVSARTQIADVQAALEQHSRNAAAAISAATEAQTQSTATMSEAQAKLQEISAVATQAVAAKAQITDAQAVIATKSDHIEGAQKHADQVRGQMDRALTATHAGATEVDGLKARTVSVADSVTQMQAAVTKSNADVAANAESVRQLLAAATSAMADVKALADKAEHTKKTIADYEARLTDFEKQSNEQLKTIVGLLPGATSAGLASAFDTRRQSFLEPSRRWQWWFVGSVIALIILGVTGLVQLYVGNEVLSYEKVLRVWLARVPVAAALVWLALYTSREASLAKRLEEDYGYKSAIAASFQGFQKQMQEIAATVGAESPLGKLCHDTLIAIASPPGRIYEKHELTVSPSGEIKELVGTLVEALGKITAK